MTDVLVGIDPGPTPGCAYRITLSDGRHGYLTATLAGTEELLSWLASYSKPAHVACEIFATGGRVDSNMLYTVECVGAVKAACFLLKVPLHMQRPPERKSFIRQAHDILKTRAYHTPHETDALAHLLLLEDRLRTGEYK